MNQWEQALTLQVSVTSRAFLWLVVRVMLLTVSLALLVCTVCTSVLPTAASPAERDITPQKFKPVIDITGQGSNPRIVGGYEARQGELPYQVSIRSAGKISDYGHFCGGSIINDSIILTAAHCVYNTWPLKLLFIVAGSNNLSVTKNGSGYEKRWVKSAIIHPDYGPVYQDYDVALLFLDQPLLLNQRTISAVPLQTLIDLPSGVMCKASGWGTTESAQKGLPDGLRVVDLPTVDTDSCDLLYAYADDYAPVIESMMCAGYEEGMKDACQGDSGGPLVCNGLLTGIVSWGNSCAMPRFPGVYTEVAFVRSWIEQYLPLAQVNSTTPGSDLDSDAHLSPSAATTSTATSRDVSVPLKIVLLFYTSTLIIHALF